MANGLLLPPQNLLPVGFRFHPTDEELFNHYLKNKIVGEEFLVQYIRQVDICNYEPWELPRLSNDQTGDQQWFFFSAQDFKYSNGRRSNRATRTGYWKSTGKDRKILARGTKNLIGTKKTLVFYSGRVPNGDRTNWVIHEYHLHPDPNLAQLKSFVICLLKRKWDESDVLMCEEAEPNGLLTSSNLPSANQNQGIPGNGQSLFQSDLQVSDYDVSELQSPLFSDPEPTSMDFQVINSYWTHVNGPTDEDVNSILVDDENCYHEGTSNSSIGDFNFNWEELFRLVNEDQGGGLIGDTGMDTALRWQYDHASHSVFSESACSRIQTNGMPMIKESRRSPLTSKIFKYGEAKDRLQTNCLLYHSDDSDKETRNFSSQHQPKSHKVLNHVDASQNVQSRTETQPQVVPSLSKAEVVPKRIKVARAAATSNEDSVEDQQSEVKNGVVAYWSKSTGHGSPESVGKCFSSILTTKCIHHKLSPASYFARACVGFILFITIARQVLLYGN
ncbi:NAC domain-containing protein 101-like [Benincasa hispida]|uniref:NAC domain-containing protein 101-like n=1 Tax=Benincasa hispida TaxID=102211 RepID=UPI0018FF4E73|nr:NAC domain-containing protein 101-like [Benincasa hispida]